MVAEMLVVLSIEEPGENVGVMSGCVYCAAFAPSCFSSLLMRSTLSLGATWHAHTRFLSTRLQWLRETYNGHGFELPQSWTQLRIPTGKYTLRSFFAGSFQKLEY
jgi:hypothetical protein